MEAIINHLCLQFPESLCVSQCLDSSTAACLDVFQYLNFDFLFSLTILLFPNPASFPQHSTSWLTQRPIDGVI